MIIRVILIITEVKVEVEAKAEVRTEVGIIIGVRIIGIPHMTKARDKITDKINQKQI